MADLAFERETNSDAMAAVARSELMAAEHLIKSVTADGSAAVELALVRATLAQAAAILALHAELTLRRELGDG
jgi:hypothetical protein